MKRLQAVYCLVFLLLGQSAVAQESSRQPQIIHFQSGKLTLGGELYKPNGDGPFPTVLYNHGSAPGMLNSQAAAIIGPLYVSHGWAYFMPYRRGQGLSEKAGPYIGDAIDTAEKTGGMFAGAVTLERILTTDQFNDQMAALEWLKKQPFVNLKQIAVAGNSFGGIETILGAAQEPFCAAIAAAAAGESWSQAPSLQKTLKNAVRHSKAPLFFFQAENDFDTSPSKILSNEMKAAGKQYAVKIYPAFGKGPKDGHSFPYRGSSVWEGDVFAFLKKHCFK